MDRYLIDTDIMIDVSRGNENAAALVDSLGDAAISVITAQELIVGAKDCLHTISSNCTRNPTASGLSIR